MTAPTPITMPSMVSSDRILLRVSARTAIRKIAMKSIKPPVKPIARIAMTAKIAEI